MIDFIKEYVEVFFVGLTVLSVAVYALLIALYLFKCERVVSLLDKGGWEYTFGIPISGVVATVLVVLFGVAFPGDGKYTFDAFSLKFTGPAGPATLWLLAFAVFIAAIRILRR